MNPKKIEISHRTIIFTVFFLIFLWMLFQVKQILLIVFICLILMSALNPSITRLENHKWPRWLAILLMYFIAIFIVGVGIGGIIPALINQTTTLIERLPDFLRQFNFIGIDDRLVVSQISEFTSIPANLLKFILGMLSNIVEVFTIAVITFYLLLERRNLDDYLVRFLGEDTHQEVNRVVTEIETRLGNWIRGQIMLMLAIGFLSYLGYVVIGIEFALPLAILAFVFELLPSIGPVVSAVPAVLIGLTISPLHAVAVAGWCFLIQQVENSVLVPRIMKQVAGVNSLVSILAIAIGFQLAGIGGAMLAIPTYLVIEIVLTHLINRSTTRTKKPRVIAG